MKSTSALVVALVSAALWAFGTGCGNKEKSAPRSDSGAADDDEDEDEETSDETDPSSGTASDEDTERKAPTKAKPVLAITGSWERACYPLPAAEGAAATYRLDTIKFEAGTYESREREFQDQACTTLLVELRATGGYELGSLIKTSKTTAELDMTPESAFVTVTSDAGVALFTELAKQQKCTLTVVKDKEQDFSDCLPMNPVFSVVKATATKLYTAAASTADKDAKDGSTAAKRPSAVSNAAYTKAASTASKTPAAVK